jgi:hypothetical protein
MMAPPQPALASTQSAANFSLVRRPSLQRKCDCGSSADRDGGLAGRGKRNDGGLLRHAADTRAGHPFDHEVVQSPGLAPDAHDFSRVQVRRRLSSATVARQKAPGGAVQPPLSASPAAPQLPTCNMQAVAQWIPDPKRPREQLPGLTQLTGAAGAQPDFKLGPGPAGKGFVVLPTTASIPTIQSKFLDVGRYIDRRILNFRPQEGSQFPSRPGGYLNMWEITPDGSMRLRAAEQEHCDDLRLAFYMSLYRFAEIVNEMAQKGTVFPSESAARAALGQQVKIDPINLPAYFTCVSEWMQKERDDKKWHTPSLPPVDSIAYDDTVRDQVAIRRLSGNALPEVGKHSSVDLFFNGAAPACLQHTTMAPASPATQQQPHGAAPPGSQIRREAIGEAESAGVPAIVHEVLRASGEPLESQTRDVMEEHFGHDFSDVRVHSGTKAAESARSVNATAYTVGNHIVFGAGRFAPGEAGGRRLLAHELAHVIQQENVSERDLQSIAPVDDPMEMEAVRAETRADTMLSPDSGAALRREPQPGSGATVKLDYTKGVPRRGQCGDYEWKIRWVLNGATNSTNGFIVQKAKAVFIGTDCDNKIADTLDFWWEAWQVKGGKIMSGISDRESLGDEFRSVNTVGTKGTQYSTGAAKFIENYTEPFSWGRVKQAGSLPATTTPPPGWNEAGSKYRYIGISDYTCCEEPRQHGKLTTEELDV